MEAREIWLCRNNEVAENMKEGSKYATKPTLHSNFYPLRHQQQTLHEPHNGASESLSPLSDSSPHSVDGEISNAAVSLFARGRDYLRDHVAQVYVVGECAPLVLQKPRIATRLDYCFAKAELLRSITQTTRCLAHHAFSMCLLCINGETCGTASTHVACGCRGDWRAACADIIRTAHSDQGMYFMCRSPFARCGGRTPWGVDNTTPSKPCAGKASCCFNVGTAGHVALLSYSL